MAATTARPEQEQPLGGAVPEEGKAWPFATTRPLDAREGLSTSGSDWSDLSDEEISDDEMREPTVNLRDLELTPKMIQSMSLCLLGRALRVLPEACVHERIWYPCCELGISFHLDERVVCVVHRWRYL